MKDQKNGLQLFLILCILATFTYVYVVELKIYDLFAFSTWGLSAEICKNARLPIKPYSYSGIEWSWVDHPNTYSELFYPHVFVAMISMVSRISAENLTLAMLLAYVLVFYLLFKKIFKFTVRDAHSRRIETISIILYTSIMILRNINYPGFAFFYISFGILMAWYTILMILYERGHNRVGSLVTLLLFIISANYSYYTSIFLLILIASSCYLFLISPLSKLLQDTLLLRRRDILISVSITALALLLLLNPLVQALRGGNKDLVAVISNAIRNFILLGIRGTGESSAYFTIHRSLLGQISSFIVRTSIIALFVMFIAFIIIKIVKPRTINHPLHGIGLTISLVLISPILTATYSFFEQPVLHTYALNVSGVMAAFYATCIANIIKLKNNSISRIVRILAIILTLSLLLSLTLSLLDSYVINVNPVLPKNFYEDSRDVADFIATYVSTQDNVFVASVRAFVAQLYFRSVFTNTTASFKYYPSEWVGTVGINSITYINDCRGTTCFYVLQYPQWPWETPSHTVFPTLLKVSLGLVYNDGKMVLIKVQ